MNSVDTINIKSSYLLSYMKRREVKPYPFPLFLKLETTDRGSRVSNPQLNATWGTMHRRVLFFWLGIPD